MAQASHGRRSALVIPVRAQLARLSLNVHDLIDVDGNDGELTTYMLST